MCITKEDLLLLADLCVDEALADYKNNTGGGGLRARATLVIEVTKIFDRLDAVTGNPTKEVVGVAV